MLATLVDNKIRAKMLGMFLRGVDPLTADIWQTKIIHCIEQSLALDGDELIVPDQYRILIPSEIISNSERYLTVKHDIKQFIGEYVNDAGYQAMKPVTVDIKAVSSGKGNDIRIFGYFSEVSEANGHATAALCRMPLNYDGQKYFTLKIPGKFYIGRSPHADICLDHQYVSHFHTKLMIDRSCKCYIKDLASTNGSCAHNRRLEPNKTVSFDFPGVIKIAYTFELLIRLQDNMQEV